MERERERITTKWTFFLGCIDVDVDPFFVWAGSRSVPSLLLCALPLDSSKFLFSLSLSLTLCVWSTCGEGWGCGTARDEDLLFRPGLFERTTSHCPYLFCVLESKNQERERRVKSRGVYLSFWNQCHFQSKTLIINSIIIAL